jgi:nucleoside-diphosphate-sugar epimerase
MKILVLGGTGAMGAHLVDILAARSADVTATSRSKQITKGSVKFIQGNAKDPTFFEKLLTEDWDAIVDFMVYSTAEFRYRIPSLLGSTGHYLYLSSARVYAESVDPLSEDSPRLLDSSDDAKYLRTDEYALTKARQEDILFRSHHNNWTIIRPYISYSSNRLQMGVLEKEDWLYRALHGRTLATSADIHQRTTTLTHGADVAAGIASLIGNSKAYAEAFHITAPQSILWSQVLDIYLDVLASHLGERPKVILQTLDEFTRWRKGRYQIFYDRLYHRQFNNHKISQFIDTSRFTAPLTGIKNSLEQFLQTPSAHFNAINWQAEAIKDRLLNENTPIAEISGNMNKLKYLFFHYAGLAR